MNPGDPAAPNPWTPPPTSNPWSGPPPSSTTTPTAPPVVAAKEGEIVSILLNYSGTSQLNQVFPSAWYNGLEETFQWVGVGRQLGYQGSKTYDRGVLWDDEYAAGLFAWEAVAEYVVPKDKSFPIWEAYCSNLYASYVDKDSASYVIRDSVQEFRDGPHGQNINLYGFSSGMHNKGYVFDAPRLNGPFAAGNTFSLRGDWRLVAATKLDKWQLRFHLEFSFSDSAPQNGAGTLTVLEAPHRV